MDGWMNSASSPTATCMYIWQDQRKLELATHIHACIQVQDQVFFALGNDDDQIQMRLINWLTDCQLALLASRNLREKSNQIQLRLINWLTASFACFKKPQGEKSNLLALSSTGQGSWKDPFFVNMHAQCVCVLACLSRLCMQSSETYTRHILQRGGDHVRWKIWCNLDLTSCPQLAARHHVHLACM